MTRHAVRPLTVDLALVSTPDWRTGLEFAGRFAPFYSRAIVLPRTPRDLHALRARAYFYAIGVVVADPQPCRLFDGEGGRKVP